MQKRGRTSLFEDLLTMATRLPWWMDLMIAVFAYIGFHLWHVHFLHEMNQMNESVPVPVATNPAAAIPNAVNTGMARGGIVVGNIMTEVFQYAIPALFVMGSISSAIREQKMKRRKWDGTP
ncbi:hypothetical protein [Acidithiobacillus sulfurivorans]|uniref:Conjugal transfer protein TraG n=1 Tax=Acidithiobacillus sulfurivorans TaxID=1958756 RepID=A0ABS5ZY89_9PROT|nr:hypothetical protein [Acidithiobacillus sulfurivorans]MBU2760078.1 hypothetical protein [Acidithiobacillus sulfurivorans]